MNSSCRQMVYTPAARRGTWSLGQAAKRKTGPATSAFICSTSCMAAPIVRLVTRLTGLRIFAASVRSSWAGKQPKQAGLRWREGEQRIARFRENLSVLPLAGQDASGDTDLDVACMLLFEQVRSVEQVDGINLPWPGRG